MYCNVAQNQPNKAYIIIHIVVRNFFIQSKIVSVKMSMLLSFVLFLVKKLCGYASSYLQSNARWTFAELKQLGSWSKRARVTRTCVQQSHAALLSMKILFRPPGKPNRHNMQGLSRVCYLNHLKAHVKINLIFNK